MAYIFGNISLAFILILPFLMFFILWKNRDNLDDEEIEEKYGLYYNELKTDTFAKSIFHVIFISRRL